MYSCRWPAFSFRLPRRSSSVVAVLLFAMVVQLVPVSIPTSKTRVEKDRSQPFPCQDRPCGCRSAEHCRKKCCCFTPQQKTAWAKKEARSRERTAALASTESTELKPVRQCCSTKRLPSSRSELARSKTVHKPMSKQRVVVGISAQKCDGVEQSLLGHLLYPVPISIDVDDPLLPTGERIIPPAFYFRSVRNPPPEPPPRIAVCTNASGIDVRA